LRKNYFLYYDNPIIKQPITKRTKNGCFEKGNIPWNKEIKGLHHSPGTEFKKGNLPANTKYNGCITLRKKDNGEKYYYIRIAKAKWVLYQRYLWEQKHGSIPEGMLIAFKDKNSLNYVLENLEIISRSENMERNRNHKKMAKTMKKLWDTEKLRVQYSRPQQTKLRVGNITGINTI